MAKPRIFISSTFYDLRHVRSDLDAFLVELGYEPVRNEEGDISYGKTEALEEYCYKEIKNIDILVSLVGGRFGSESKRNHSSISQIELKTAIREDKQVYIFVEKNVLSEYETYLLNKDVDLKYKYADDIRIYKFIEELKSLNTNNNIKSFETVSEITRYLKEQFAGLFQRFLEQQTRVREMNIVNNLEKTAQTLNKLVNYLSDENKESSEEINRILTINHPLVQSLRTQIEIPYNFYIEGKKDMTHLLNARGYEDEPFTMDTSYLEFNHKKDNKKKTLKIANLLFDEEGKLKFFRNSDWEDHWVKLKEENIDTVDDDVPF